MRTSGIALLVLLTAACQALSQSSAPEPDIADVFYRLDAGNLVALERRATAYKGGAHGFVVVKIKMAATLPGGKSPVRFKAGEPLEFVVKTLVNGNFSDPAELYFLRQLEAKKNQRQLTTTKGTFSPIGGSATTAPLAGVLPVEFARHGAGSLLIKSSGLKPGEYALGRNYGPFAFCFGVD
jgi:hypothetical protein